jgi:integrase
VENYLKAHPGTNEQQALQAVANEKFEGGIKLVPKDLRDYFASTVETDDPRVLISLMRHTNLTTTTKYLRAMHERMKRGSQRLGGQLWAQVKTPHGGKKACKTT